MLDGGSQEENLPIGVALLSNTHICEASFLMDWTGQHVRPSWPLRICDAMSLIDAAVLHEKIYYLPTLLSLNAGQSVTRSLFIKHGIISQFPTREPDALPYETFQAVRSTLSDLPPLPTLHPDPTPIACWRLKRLLASALNEKEDDIFYRPTYTGIRQNSFDMVVRALVVALVEHSSGLYEQGVNGLRAMHYACTSEHYKMPYLPSAGVELIVNRFPNYFEPATREKLYGKLTLALKESIDTIIQESRSSVILVPPFSAIAMNRAAGPASLFDEMMALRDEYSGFRRNMQELEHEMRESASISDRLRTINKIEKLGREVSRPFEEPGSMWISPSLRYIPDAVDVVSNPTNPATWVKALFELPTDALISWYTRRPIAKLTRAGRVVGKLARCDTLVEKHFGESVARKVHAIQRTGLLPPPF